MGIIGVDKQALTSQIPPPPLLKNDFQKKKKLFCLKVGKTCCFWAQMLSRGKTQSYDPSLAHF